ncbi:MAG: response regulator [Elusimicrobia bacterium]|nr:response regulator [Elusimicrobiota bacterium]
MKSRILVVDDEEAISRTIGRIIMKMGHEAALAAQGEEAVRMMQDQNFDLLITDLKLPGMGGIEILKHFKEKFPDSLAVVITGYPTLETAQAALRLGAWEYLAKPFEVADLETVVHACLEVKAGVPCQGKTVLVVEDHPAFSRFLSELFSLRKIPCVVAASGEEALKRMGESKPDLVLADIGLPGCSGLELCRKIKNDPAMKNIPVVLMTATYIGHAGIAEEANHSGADLFIAKPADPYEICYYVLRFLNPTGGAGDKDRTEQ